MNLIRKFFNFLIYLFNYSINLIRYRFMNPKDVFKDIYIKNIWNNRETFSGDSSTIEQTKVLRKELKFLIEEFNIDSMLDIPCGDFNWMKSIKLDVDYIGADIVEDIVIKNCRDYSSYGKFKVFDICSTLLPKVDLLFCRDCLVHLSNEKAITAIDNIKKSGSRYLLITTFPKTNNNKNIITGSWRALNMEQLPFLFPAPIKIINEEFNLRAGRFTDKSMALWKVKDL